jgi:hypothetical protein
MKNLWESMECYRNNFFIFKVTDKKLKLEFLFHSERHDINPYEIREPIIRKRFEMFQSVRVAPVDKEKRVIEREFFNTYSKRKPPTIQAYIPDTLKGMELF